MDLAFKALQEDFAGTWPAKLRIENPEYAGTLFYAGADPSGDAGEYATDLAAGKLDRKNLSAICEPKDPERSPVLIVCQGRVFVKPMPVAVALDIDAARELAAALDGFITARFGPAD